MSNFSSSVVAVASRRSRSAGACRAIAWQLDWATLDEQFACIRNLAGCPQDPIYHAEGDVWAIGTTMSELLKQLQSCSGAIGFST
jgi:hypothetical protein